MNAPRQTPSKPFAILALVLGSVACRPETHAAEIPLPALDDVEQEVVEAILSARESLLREPASGKAWGRLGDHYFVHEFTAQAAECYSRAEELDSESFLWPFRMGMCLLKDHPELAVAPIERSLRSLDNYAPAHEVYASVLVRLGRSDEAIEHYGRAIQLDPARAEAETGLGVILLSRGDFDAARLHLEAALSHDNRHVEAYASLAQVYLALGMEKKARRYAELARTLPQSSLEWDTIATPDLPPTGARARTRLGRQLEEQGRTAEATEQYRAALRSNPNYYLARRSLSFLLAGAGRSDEAIGLLREAEAANPAFAEVRKDLARLAKRQDSLAENEEGDE